MNLLLRLLVGLARWTLGLFAVLLVLAALYVSLGRGLVPLFAEYRVAIQQRAADALRAPLAIGRLEGGWQGMVPELVAHDVLVGEGNDVLRLDQVRLRPDLLGSLLHWQPRLAGLTVSGLQLVVRQNADGRWHAQGLPRQENTGELDPEHWLRQLRRFPQVAVIDSQLVLHAHAAQPLSLNYLNLSLTGSGEQHRLDGSVLLPDGQPVTWQWNSRLRPEAWRDAQLDLYLRLPQSDWSRWLPAGLTGNWQVQRLRAGGEVWLEWAERDLRHAVARLNAPQLHVAYAEREALQLGNLALKLYYQRTAQGRRLFVESLAVTLGEQRWGPAQVLLDERADGWQLSADRLDLAPLAQGVRALAPLPEKAAEVLDALQPRGVLSNLQLTYRPQAEPAERLRYAANLAGVAFAAYHGAPAAEGVDGSVQGDLRQGELRLNSDAFALHLEQLFAEPWRYRQAQARLVWQFDDEAVSLWAPYLRVVGEEGNIAGDFLIRLRHDPQAEDYMDLRVGLSDGDARFTGKYLPTRSPALSPALAEWLQKAIRAGRVEQGYFQYQGALNKGAAPEARTLGLYFKVRDAELDYQSGWPALRQARGEVFVEDSGVRVRIDAGELLDSRVLTATAQVPHPAPGKVARLRVDARLDSSVGDGLNILQNSPLPTAETFAGWQGEGAVEAQLQLDIALAGGQPPRVRVDFTPRNASLALPKPQLQLSEVHGRFRYDTQAGLSARDLRAKAFGHAVRGAIGSEGPAGRRIQVDVRGQVPVATLTTWLGVERPVPASGLLPYRLRLRLDGEDSQLRVDSSLQGVTIDLPAPFGKSAAQSRYADWRMSLAGEERYYWLDYAEQASLALALPDNDPQRLRGELRLGAGRAQLSHEEGLLIQGQLEEFDWAAWRAAQTRYSAQPSGAGQLPVRHVELYLHRFTGFGQDVPDLMLRLKRDERAWALTLDSRRVAGSIHLPDVAGVPIRAELKHLRLPAAAAPAAATKNGPAEKNADPLAQVDPRSLPALDLRIATLLQGDAPLGRVAFKLRPSERGLRASELDLDLRGLKIGGEVGWDVSAGGAQRSWYRGRLQGDDLGRILIAWGYAPTASSESFRLDADASWPGSPAALSPERLSGTLNASMRKGQFSEVQGGASALRVFGLLNFNAIGRRLRLDFSDLFGRGLSYDRVSGAITVRDGVYSSAPLSMTGPSAGLEFSGRLDLPRDRIDGRLQVSLPLTNNLPLAALIAGAPAIGGALFVVDKLLGDRVARFASVEYEVSGSTQSPQITYGKPVESAR